MGTIEDWVMEGHRLAQTAACGDLGSENPAAIEPAYQRQADPVIELQTGKGRREAGLPSKRCFEMKALTRCARLDPPFPVGLAPTFRWRILGVLLAHINCRLGGSNGTVRQLNTRAVIDTYFVNGGRQGRSNARKV